MGLGKRFINANSCLTVQDLAQATIDGFNEIGDAGAGGLTAGCGVVIADGVVSARPDNVTIACTDGLLTAIGGGADYFAGLGLELTTGPNTFNVKTDGITIAVNGSNELEVITVPVDLDQGDGIRIGTPSPGIEIAVELAATPGLEFSGGKLRAKVDPVGGIERVAAGLKDKWPYRIIKGQATTNYHPGTGTVAIDHVISLVGEEIASSDSDVIVCRTQQDIYLDNDEEVYAIYCEDPESGLTSNWSICTALNLAALLKGYNGFNADKNVSLGWNKDNDRIQWSATGNIIFAQVNASSGVAVGDTSFSFYNAIAISGVVPAGGVGTAHKQGGKASYSNDDYVVLFQRHDNEQWWTDEQGGGGGGAAIATGRLVNNLTTGGSSGSVAIISSSDGSTGNVSASNTVDLLYAPPTGAPQRYVFQGNVDSLVTIQKINGAWRFLAVQSPRTITG